MVCVNVLNRYPAARARETRSIIVHVIESTPKNQLTQPPNHLQLVLLKTRGAVVKIGRGGWADGKSKSIQLRFASRCSSLYVQHKALGLGYNAHQPAVDVFLQ